MTPETKHLGEIDQPVLVFGGPYGNWQATEAVLARADDLGIPPERIVCTGDTVAYCGDAVRTVAALRQSGIHVVMGNCEESLGLERQDCGCGFEEGSDCDLLSVQWFAYSQKILGDDDKIWMSSLPRKLTFGMNGRTLAVIHGGADNLSQFIFRSSSANVKNSDLDNLGVDGVIAGHCGLPFTDTIENRVWHNAGVIGMPANDGTPRTWYSVLNPTPGGIEINTHSLDYDHEAAAARMFELGLPEAYARTLTDGLWPNMDVLPENERTECGQSLAPQTVLW